MSFLKGKKICVTGGTGFLGSHLLPILIDQGAEVACLVRQKPVAPQLACRVCTVDLLSGAGLREALAGQDILIHMAALLFGYQYQDYLHANSMAAWQIGLAAKDVPKVIHISSLAAAGPCAVLPGIDEKAIPQPVSAYGWSKLVSEEILGRLLGDALVVLRPPIIYGSGDRGLLPVFRGIGRGLAAVPGKKFPVSIIHADDAARAIVCCASDKANGAYHVSDGAPLDMADFYRALANAMGREKLSILNVPLPIMGLGAGVCGLVGQIGKIFGRRPPNFNPDKYREARAGGWLANDAKIRSELGFAPQISLEEGAREAVEGYRKLGML